jgi:hypothetical protein
MVDAFKIAMKISNMACGFNNNIQASRTAREFSSIIVDIDTKNDKFSQSYVS